MLQKEIGNRSDDQPASDEDSDGKPRDYGDPVGSLIDVNPPFHARAWVQLPRACTFPWHSIRIEHDRLARINLHGAPRPKR